MMLRRIAIVCALFLTPQVFAEPVAIKSYTADDAGFYVNSHIISGDEGMYLIDAQFTKSNAERLVSILKKQKNPLLGIIVTHAHPDHYFGLETIHAAFPQAPIYSAPAVIEEMKKTGPQKLEFWRQYLKDEMPQTLVYPEEFPKTYDKIRLSGSELNILSVNEAESETSLMVHLPAEKSLITGDLVYSGVHLWLAEGRAFEWLKQLDRLEKIPGVEAVYPGHGPAGDRQLFTENKKYIRFFTNTVTRVADSKLAAKKIKDEFPNYKRSDIVDYSVPAYYEK